MILELLRSYFKTGFNHWTFWILKNRKNCLVSEVFHFQSIGEFQKLCDEGAKAGQILVQFGWGLESHIKLSKILRSPREWYLCRSRFLWRENPQGINPNSELSDMKTRNQNNTFLLGLGQHYNMKVPKWSLRRQRRASSFWL